MDCVVIHYSEIGLKGDNRPYFENKLASNIKSITGLKVVREYGRLVMDYEKSKLNLLKNIPGIAYYSPAIRSRLNINELIIKGKELVKKGPFRVTARRSNKKFKYSSPEINRLIGEAIDLKVNLEKPRTELFIEVGERNAYLYTKKYEGLGGLPVGVTGKLIALVSGGIDSPVACYEMIRRGCEVIMLHFFNESEGVKNKMIELAEKLSKYQGKTKLIMIPFLATQREIIMNVPAKIRMITYRRLMLKIGEEVLRQEKALGFITGDNVAQVASQTLENLKAIWAATSENVYAPLISYDKEEIIIKAKKIGTYEISIKPHSDCCSYLIAKHPETRAVINEIINSEKNLNIKELVKKALGNMSIAIIK